LISRISQKKKNLLLRKVFSSKRQRNHCILLKVPTKDKRKEFIHDFLASVKLLIQQKSKRKKKSTKKKKQAV